MKENFLTPLVPIPSLIVWQFQLYKEIVFYAGVVHRLVRRPSKPDRWVRFPSPAPAQKEVKAGPGYRKLKAY